MLPCWCQPQGGMKGDPTARHPTLPVPGDSDAAAPASQPQCRLPCRRRRWERGPRGDSGVHVGSRSSLTPAREPSLGLAGQVGTELLLVVVGLVILVQSFDSTVLVIAGADNPAVDGLVERSDRKKGGEVGNKPPREGPGCWHLWGFWRCKYHKVAFLDIMSGSSQKNLRASRPWQV